MTGTVLTLAEASSLDRLTPRQREVLQLVAEGATTKEIARKLGVSVKTAEMHVEPRGKRRGAPVRLQSCRDVATSPAHNCHDAAGPGNLERMS